MSVYKDYLKSGRWNCLRRMALDRDRHSCRVCDSRDSLEVHHRSYKNKGHYNLVKELDDLTTLCRQCHQLNHWRDLLYKLASRMHAQPA